MYSLSIQLLLFLYSKYRDTCVCYVIAYVHMYVIGNNSLFREIILYGIGLQLHITITPYLLWLP